MRITSLILLCWFCWEVSAAPKFTGILSEAGEAIRNGKNERALDLLKSVGKNDANYPLSLLEGARLEYRAGQWPQFFALTGYLRNVYPRSPEASKAAVLESLGLIRHCQFANALRRMEEKHDSELNATWVNARKVIHHWLEALPKSKLPKTGGDDDIAKVAWFPHEVVWPVKFESGQMAPFDPYALRQVILSRCQGSKR